MKFSFKEIIWTIIFIIIAAFIISGTTHALFLYSKAGSDWISALISFSGNILGGIAGGIVAIIVAKYQIYRSKVQEKTKQNETTKTMLKLIREELRDNITVLSNAIPYNQADYNTMKSNLSDDTWKSTMLHLSLEDEFLVKLHICYKKISLIKNLDSSSIDDDTLSSCKVTVEQALDSTKEQIKKVL